MIKAKFKFTGDWNKLAHRLNSERFKKALDENMTRATKMNGALVVAEIRRRIRAKRYAANAPLTALIKGSTTPLVEESDLFNAVTSVPVDSTSVFVGVLRIAKSKDGTSLANIAELLHEGGSIKVTDSMRALFSILSDFAKGKVGKADLSGRALELAEQMGDRVKQIKPLKPSTVALVIPPRKFLLSVFADPIVKRKIAKNWAKAAEESVLGEGGGAPVGPPSAAQQRKAASRAKGKRIPKPKKPPANRSEAAKRGWKTRRSKVSSSAPKP